MGKSLCVLARNVPAMGYRTYVPAPTSVMESAADDGSGATRQSSPPTLENSFFRLRLDPARGVVASLVDKRSGRELVDPASEYGLGQYVYERFDADEATAYVKAYCRNSWPWVFQDFAKSACRPPKTSPMSRPRPRNFQCQH